MIFHRTLLNSADNSGALKLMCIKVLESAKSCGRVGSKLVVCVKRYIPNKKVKKGEIRNGIVVRQSFPIIRSSGLVIYFLENSLVIVDKKNNPISSRVIGPVTHELRFNNFMKIISMASCSL